MYKMFDAHCHIYPDAIAAKAVEGIDRFYDHVPFDHHDGTTGTLVKVGKEAGISHYLVHSVATTPRQVSGINRFIASEVTASDGAFTGLGTMHPDSEHPEQDFSELADLGLKGVKLHPDFQRFEADSRKAMRIYGLCAEAGLPVLVHTGDYRFNYSNPDRIVGILRAFPKLKFVGAHFGGWSMWDEAVKRLPRFTNFYVDCSSSLYLMTAARAKEIIDAFGANRVLWGSDYPMWESKAEMERFERIDLTDEQKDLILYKNASKLLGVEI
jgi:predicted TIM-barrel fold metal-dependent hydrolase